MTNEKLCGECAGWGLEMASKHLLENSRCCYFCSLSSTAHDPCECPSKFRPIVADDKLFEALVEDANKGTLNLETPIPSKGSNPEIFSKAGWIVKEILGYLDDWDDDPEPCDYTDQIRPLVLKIEPLLLNNKKLIEFARLVKECPANTVVTGSPPTPRVTHSAKLRFQDGTEVEIPEPGEGWTKQETVAFDWPAVYSTDIGISLNWLFTRTVCSGPDCYAVNHVPGQMILKEYTPRIWEEVVQVLDVTEWTRQKDINNAASNQ